MKGVKRLPEPHELTARERGYVLEKAGMTIEIFYNNNIQWKIKPGIVFLYRVLHTGFFVFCGECGIDDYFAFAK
jgi:hypothetical protein